MFFLCFKDFFPRSVLTKVEHELIALHILE
jgi:hypothetical protein